MGLGDRLKDLTKQAQEAVAEHKDQLHDAVDAASLAADRKTRGKHSARIAKFGGKAGGAIDRLAARGEEGSPGAEPGGTPPPAAG